MQIDKNVNNDVIPGATSFLGSHLTAALSLQEGGKMRDPGSEVVSKYSIFLSRLFHRPQYFYFI